MKIIAIGAVTAGGKTTVVNAVRDRLPRAVSLHFDDYSFPGEPDDLTEWISKREEFYNVWDLSPLKRDVERLADSGEYDYLLLDYPFAYKNRMMKAYLDCCIFIDTPLDIAMARRVLRDMKDASGDEIRREMDTYLNYTRDCYTCMLTDILPSSDYVIDGTKELETIVGEAAEMILNCQKSGRSAE